MKGNEKNILIGAVVIAVLIVLAAYKFFYSEDVAKAEQIQTEINTLNARLVELNEKNQKRPMYEEGISTSADVIKTILSLYGPGNTPEKTIMLVVDLCKKTGCTIGSVSFQDDRQVYSSGDKGDGTPALLINKGGMAINIQSGYTQFKKIIDYINSYPERMNAENFSLSFNGETGRLTCSMNVNMYSVEDENHKYEAPVIEDIEIGTVNIFRTFDVVAEEDETTEEGTNTEENNTDVTTEE